MRAGVRQAAPEPLEYLAAVSPRRLTDESGPRFPGFRAMRRLARSATAAVWLAERAGYRYALKVASTPAHAGLLRREFRIGQSLRHPCIATPSGWVDGREGSGAIVFDYLPGGDLVALAGSAPARWAGPLLDVLDALVYLHEQGIVHRDLKARNVLLDGEDRARLIDLGSCRPVGSRRTTGGTTAGHRREGDRCGLVSSDDDRYAFGVLLREMLANRAPAAAREQTLHRLVERVRGDEPLPVAKLRAIRVVLESLRPESQ